MVLVLVHLYIGQKQSSPRTKMWPENAGVGHIGRKSLTDPCHWYNLDNLRTTLWRQRRTPSESVSLASQFTRNSPRPDKMWMRRSPLSFWLARAASAPPMCLSASGKSQPERSNHQQNLHCQLVSHFEARAELYFSQDSWSTKTHVQMWVMGSNALIDSCPYAERSNWIAQKRPFTGVVYQFALRFSAQMHPEIVWPRAAKIGSMDVQQTEAGCWEWL